MSHRSGEGYARDQIRREMEASGATTEETLVKAALRRVESSGCDAVDHLDARKETLFRGLRELRQGQQAAQAQEVPKTA